MFALKRKFMREEPSQRVKENAIERVIYNLCRMEELQAPNVVDIPAFIRAQNAVEIIRNCNMVDFYFKNRKRIVEFCRRNNI